MENSGNNGRLFYTDQYVITLPDGHKFPVRKYGLVRQMLMADGLFHFERAPLAEPETLALARTLDDPRLLATANFEAGALLLVRGEDPESAQAQLARV